MFQQVQQTKFRRENKVCTEANVIKSSRKTVKGIYTIDSQGHILFPWTALLLSYKGHSSSTNSWPEKFKFCFMKWVTVIILSSFSGTTESVPILTCLCSKCMSTLQNLVNLINSITCLLFFALKYAFPFFYPYYFVQGTAFVKHFCINFVWHKRQFLFYTTGKSVPWILGKLQWKW